jgi:hypothetical protein
VKGANLCCKSATLSVNWARCTKSANDSSCWR